MKQPPLVKISGKEVLPIIEGGKGIAVSNGNTAGAFAKENAVGTVSGVFAYSPDENGNNVPYEITGRTPLERHKEIVRQAIIGGINQVKIAYEKASGNGRIHLNILWEQGGAIETIEGILEGAKGLVNGITCGAGMPYRLAEIASKYKSYYYPIVSSARAFRALWGRAFKNYVEFLGGIVYEDPWLAGGHNGISNRENPNVREEPFARVVEVRKAMQEVGVRDDIPIIIGGGVWNLSEWEEYFGSKELGSIAFQFGTRPLLTKESPVLKRWKDILLNLKQGDISLQKFSPTGFYSSAVRNGFLKDLFARKETEMTYGEEKTEEKTAALSLSKVREVFVSLSDKIRVNEYIAKGLNRIMRCPEKILVFVDEKTEAAIKKNRSNCCGCLSACQFSSWTQYNDSHTTGATPDPRLFCIYKTLNDAINPEINPDNTLIFSGHLGYRFALDPMYKDGNIPTIKELIEAIIKGE